MKQDERTCFDRALEGARLTAFPPGEFVGQESFMLATEIRSLAVRAGIAPGVSVLDLCCGVAGPGRLITAELGCTYLGVDASASAIDLARERAADLPCRFAVEQIPPVPPGPFDVVLLLETLLAFADKESLLRSISSALASGGRFAFTVEEGRPLTVAERARMPDADTVWPVPLADLLSCLERVGLRVRWMKECSRPHLLMADALLGAFTAQESVIAADLGQRAVDELMAAHRLWSDWLSVGRVRKFAVVAEKVAAPSRRMNRTKGPYVLQMRPGRRGSAPTRTTRRSEDAMNMRLLAATAVLVSAAVHLYLWFDGVREDDVIGPAFMLNAVGGAVIAALLLVWRHWLPPLLAVGFGFSTLTAFVISATVGLFGFDSTWEGWEVWTAAAAEVVAIVTGLVLLAQDNPLRSRRELQHDTTLGRSHLN